jgi:hypothetical protein
VGGAAPIAKRSKRRLLAIEILEDRTAPAILAAPISLSVVHGQVLEALLSNYVTGADSTPTIALTGTPLSGSASLAGTNLMTYQSSVNFAGLDQIGYTATDSTASSSATITFNVTETAPTVQDQTLSVLHDQPLSYIDLSAGVTNPDGAALQYSIVTGPTNGTVAFDADGTYTFTPNAGFTGTDSFTFKANDGIADSNTATVTISVFNHAPVIGPDLAYSVLPYGMLTFNDLTANATDADGDALSVVIDTSPTITSNFWGNAQGTYFYEFNQHDFPGSDSFTYHLWDGLASSDTVTVSINCVNTEIVANPVIAQTYMDEEVVVWPLVNAMSSYHSYTVSEAISSYSSPAHGTVTLDANGQFDYVPNDGYTGKDSFSFTVTDGVNFATSSISINVLPTAADADYSVLHDQALTGIDLSQYAADDDGGPLQVHIMNGPGHGQLTANTDGTYTFTPNAGWTGTDRFTFNLTNGIVDSHVATVTISVTDQAPVAVAEDFALHAGLILSLDSTSGILHEDYDADGDHLLVQLVGALPSNGTLNLNADGSFTYQANQGFVGVDAFLYRLFDGAMYSDTMTVTIHVEDQAPVASASSFDVWSAAGISGGIANVLANATDPEVDTLTAVLVSGPSYAASFALNADGTFSYQPAVVNGPDSFTIKAFDGTLYSDPVTVTLNVTDTPIAKDVSYVLDSSGQLTVSVDNGLVARAFNPMGAPLVAQLDQSIDPSQATINVNPDGSFSLTVDPSFQGELDCQFVLNQPGQVQPIPGARADRLRAMIRVVREDLLSSLIGLQSVNFQGNAIIQRDVPASGQTVAGNYESPQWLQQLDMNAAGVVTGVAAGAANNQSPISFTRGTRISLTPSFEISQGMLPFWRGFANNVLVRATSQLIAPGLNLNLGGIANPVPLRLVGNQLTTNGFVQMDNPLPNYTDYYGSLNLTWSLSVDNGDNWFSPWTANTSSNQTFVTLADPKGVGAIGAALPQVPIIKQTVFYAGIWGSIGSTNADVNPVPNDTHNLIKNVFAGFASRTITRADGTPMTYYGQWTTSAATATALIQTADGRCTAWARFFIDVLRAQGGDFSYAVNAKGIEVRPAARTRVWGFLVKNWNFQNAGLIPAGEAWDVPRRLGYTHANEVTGLNPAQLINQNQYNWVGGNANAGFTDQPGIPGQNTTNPQSLFQNHFVVKIGDKLYDPSYGVTYDWAANNQLGDFQTKAIAGIVGGFRNRVTQRLYFVARTPAANEMNQLFELNPFN